MFGMPGGENNVVTRLLDRPPAQVEVLRSAETVEWQGESVPCWVVVTDQDKLHLRVWARVDNGLILKQSAEWGPVRIDIIRENVFKIK
jgi:hypothetical protein